MHEAAYRFVQSVMPSLPDGPVLEIGSRDVNGSIRGLFHPRAYLGIDVVPGPGVDVVADGSSFVPMDPPQIVICMEALEHTPQAAAICAQAHAILQAGGWFIVTAAGDGRPPHSAVDGYVLRPGEYYENVSADALREWLTAFNDVTITVNDAAKDIYATARKAA